MKPIKKEFLRKTPLFDFWFLCDKDTELKIWAEMMKKGNYTRNNLV